MKSLLIILGIVLIAAAMSAGFWLTPLVGIALSGVFSLFVGASGGFTLASAVIH